MIELSAGDILIDGQTIRARPPAELRRNIGYVIQQIGLFPHLTIGDNVGVVPRLLGWDRARVAQRVQEMLELVSLPADMRDRFPAQLSGGQRQRVGVARALAGGPHLLLMDEPFGALDPVTRDALGASVRKLHGELGLTTLMVTHDMAEALLLADRVLVMDAGELVADETPAALLAGAGGEIAQALVAVPRDQAERLAAMRRGA
jgi:osmoprotectant transport system ATP-binding protein